MSETSKSRDPWDRRARIYVRQLASVQVSHNRESNEQHQGGQKSPSVGWTPMPVQAVDNEIRVLATTTSHGCGTGHRNGEARIGRLGIGGVREPLAGAASNRRRRALSQDRGEAGQCLAPSHRQSPRGRGGRS